MSKVKIHVVLLIILVLVFINYAVSADSETQCDVYTDVIVEAGTPTVLENGNWVYDHSLIAPFGNESEDHIYIQAAIDEATYLRKQAGAAGACVYLPNDKRYLVSDAFQVDDFIQLTSEDSKATIEYTPQTKLDTTWQHGAIIYTTNYASFHKDAIQTKTPYLLRLFKEDQKSVLLQLNKEATIFTNRYKQPASLKGELVVILDGVQYDKGTEENNVLVRSRWSQVNKISSVEYIEGRGTSVSVRIRLADRLNFSAKRDKSADNPGVRASTNNWVYPVLYLLNTEDYSSKLEDTASYLSTRQDKFLSEGVHLSNLNLVQTYQDQAMSSVRQLGGCYNCTEKNISVVSGGGYPVGNMYAKTTISDVNVTTKRTAIDFGYSSSDSSLTDATYTYAGVYPSRQGYDCDVTQGTSLIFINEGSNNITLEDVTITGSTGKTNNSHAISMNMSHKATLTNVAIDMPSLNFQVGEESVANYGEGCTAAVETTTMEGNRYGVLFYGEKDSLLPTGHRLNNVDITYGDLTNDVNYTSCTTTCEDQDIVIDDASSFTEN